MGGVELAAEWEMLTVITNRKTCRENPTVWMFVVRKPKAGDATPRSFTLLTDEPQRWEKRWRQQLEESDHRMKD